ARLMVPTPRARKALDYLRPRQTQFAGLMGGRHSLDDLQRRADVLRKGGADLAGRFADEARRPEESPDDPRGDREDHVMTINHLNLTVTDPTETSDFLAKYFGLRPQGGNAGIQMLYDDKSM